MVYFQNPIASFLKLIALGHTTSVNKQNLKEKFSNVIAVDSLVLKKDVRSVVLLIIAVVNAKSCIENLIRRFVRGTRKVKLKLK